MGTHTPCSATDSMPAAKLLRPLEVCSILDITPRQLRDMRAAGTAPEHFNIATRITRYLSTSVHEKQQHERRSNH